MDAQISKWGNSLAIRLPKHLADQVQFTEGTSVTLSIEEGAIVLRKAGRSYALDQLLAGITPENIHREIQTGSAVGLEVW